MRKRTISAVLGASATAVLAPLALFQVASAGARPGRTNRSNPPP